MEKSSQEIQSHHINNVEQPDSYDAVEDYFNNALAGGADNNTGLKSRSFHGLRPTKKNSTMGVLAANSKEEEYRARPRAMTNDHEAGIRREADFGVT